MRHVPSGDAAGAHVLFTLNIDLALALDVDGENRIEERRVQLGLESNNCIEIVSGLSEGERVLIGSRSEFRAGDRVEPKPIAENQEAGS